MNNCFTRCADNGAELKGKFIICLRNADNPFVESFLMFICIIYYCIVRIIYLFIYIFFSLFLNQVLLAFKINKSVLYTISRLLKVKH
jgi:hypothetical protein